MTAVSYSAVMYKDGVQTGEILHPTEVHISKKVNDIYYCRMILPRETGFFARGLDHYGIDNIMIVTRSPKGQWLPSTREFVGLIRKRIEYETKEGKEFTELGIFGLNELLKRRNVDYQGGGSSQTLKTDFADDMMKEVVNENMGSGAIAARQFPSDWSEAADVGDAPSITFEFPHQNVYSVLRRIAEISAEDGTGLYFDVVYKSASSLEFRTYKGQIGADVSDKLLFADFYNNISRPRLEEDFSEEYNVVNVWGVGEPDDQAKSQQTAPERIDLGRWARREWSTQTSIEDADALASYAKSLLRDGRPTLRFVCDLLDKPGSIYGLDWNFGYTVKVAFNGRIYTGLVQTLQTKYYADQEEDIINGSFVYTSPIQQAVGIP